MEERLSKLAAEAVGDDAPLEAGQVWVNTHGVLAINHLAPYGGVKQSGIGRKSGIEGILEYVQSQTIATYEHA
jgi:acyl-CoA reductase-like NAD-dependent aldehyde dehydrogenase